MKLTTLANFATVKTKQDAKMIAEWFAHDPTKVAVNFIQAETQPGPARVSRAITLSRSEVLHHVCALQPFSKEEELAIKVGTFMKGHQMIRDVEDQLTQAQLAPIVEKCLEMAYKPTTGTYTSCTS